MLLRCLGCGRENKRMLEVSPGRVRVKEQLKAEALWIQEELRQDAQIKQLHRNSERKLGLGRKRGRPLP